MGGNYQIIIIGGGPAGLTSGLYSSRAGIKTLLIEKGLIGGQIVNAERIENYPGFPDGISGSKLADFMHRQAVKHGLEILPDEVTTIENKAKFKRVETNQGSFNAKAIIIASGCQRRKLEVPGEDKFLGKGVSYCAICDGPLFKDKVLAVVGGGNAAITEALSLTKFASSIKVIHRRHQLRATKALREKASAEPKIEFLWDTIVTEIQGDNIMTHLKLQEITTGKLSTLRFDGVFVAIGLAPNTGYLKGNIPLDKAGYIITNDLMETKVPGIFAAGDIRYNSPRQVITAAGDGAIAALSAERFLTQLA